MNKKKSEKLANSQLAKDVDAIANINLSEDINKLTRQVELMGRDYRKMLARRMLVALCLALITCCICLVIFAITIQNFSSWKYDVEQFSVEQSRLTKEVVQTIKDTSWIHMQRLMIKDMLDLSKLQIEDFKKMEEYKKWELIQHKKKENKNGKGNIK